VALDAAAAHFGASREDVVQSLFADRTENRRLVAPSSIPSPREIALLYNLALVQGLVLGALDLIVRARSHVRSVVRFAKLKGLLCTYGTDSDALRIALSGPLSVLRQTTKYGLALASFVPAVVATPGWTLEARCRARGITAMLKASSKDPIASTHALPRDTDSLVERRLLRDVRRLASAWTIERETTVVRLREGVFFPDFTLRRGDERVLVEIVGYYTPEYLESKLRVFREAGLRRIIVCVDEELACGDDQVVAGAVIRYRRRVDAATLIAAAERLVAERA
jgi:predicted nuclease of restriction endonuclease-like RecB superfamily